MKNEKKVFLTTKHQWIDLDSLLSQKIYFSSIAETFPLIWKNLYETFVSW